MIIKVSSSTPFHLAWQLSEAQLDAFQGDDLFEMIFGKRYSFPVPPPEGTARDFFKIRYSTAWNLWLKLQNSNYRSYIIKHEGELAGFICWELPKQLRQYSRLLVLKLWVLGKMRSLVNFLLFFGESNKPVFTKRLNDFFDRALEAAGLQPARYRPEQLAKLSHKELLNAPYPIDDYFWCNNLFVRPKFHGLGLGKRLLEYSIAQLPDYEPVFLATKAPTKYALFASPQARKFYESRGFENTSEYGETIDGVYLDAPVYVRNKS